MTLWRGALRVSICDDKFLVIGGDMLGFHYPCANVMKTIHLSVYLCHPHGIADEIAVGTLHLRRNLVRPVYTARICV